MATKFKLQQSPVVLIMLCVFTTVAVVSLTVYPWVKEIMTMREELVNKEILLREGLLPKVSLLNSLDEDELDTSITALEEALPSFPYEWSVLASLEALAENSQVRLGLLSVGEKSSGSKPSAGGEEMVGVVELPITVSGDISQIIAFLKNVERAKRVIALTALSLESDGTSYRLTCQVRAPYLPIPSTLGPIEAKLQGLTVEDQEVLAQVTRLNLYGFSLKGMEDQVGGTFGKPNPF